MKGHWQYFETDLTEQIGLFRAIYSSQSYQFPLHEDFDKIDPETLAFSAVGYMLVRKKHIAMSM